MSLQDCDPIVTPTLESLDSTLTVANVVFASSSVTDGVITLPALQATWDASTNQYVTAVEFEFTPTSFAGQPKLSIANIAALSWLTTDGIIPSGVYSCRWRAVGVGVFRGDWSTPVSVTILTDFGGLAGPDGILTESDLTNFLWNDLKPNLWRFSFYTPLNGAAIVSPFAAFGEQQDAWTIPGGAAAVFLEHTGGIFGLATRDGAAYNFSFLGKVDSGTATLKWRIIDASNNPITGIADQSYSLTTTPQTFTWSGISSDDTDLVTAKIQIFTSSTSDIPAARTVTVSELMAQTDNYGALKGMQTPWRPAPREVNLLRYKTLLTTLFAAISGTKPRQTVRTDSTGTATEHVPPGPTQSITDATTARTLSLADVGAYVRFTSASAIAVTIPLASSVAWVSPGIITLSQRGAGAITVAGALGVTVNPKLGGTLVTGGAGDVISLLYAGSDTWDMI